MNYVPEQRKKVILEILELNDAITIRDVALQLGVTRETVRQDITELDAKNLLKRVRGGAMLLSSQEPSRDDRTKENPAGKSRIAKLAAKMVPDGASVLLDSGSSTYSLALELQRKKELNIITNDLDIAILLRKTSASVTVLGGPLSLHENAAEGHVTAEAAKEYLADFAFVGVGGLTAERLFSDYTREGAAVRAAMIANSTTSVVLADKSKLGHKTPVRIKNIDNINCLICDTELDRVISEKLTELEIEILLA